MQPFQVPGDANQVPFALCRLKASQQELPEPHDCLDDAEDWFYRTFALGVEFFSSQCPKPVLHPLNGISTIGQRQRLTEPIHERLVVLIPAKGKVRRDLVFLANADVAQSLS